MEHHNDTRNKSLGGRGFTLIELLIAVIIVGIIVAAIVPVYVSRAAEARQTYVQADLDSLKSAEEHAAIDTGYIYRLYILQDTQGGDNIGPNSPNDQVIGIVDESLRSDVPNPKIIFIDTKYGTILINGSSIFDRMVDNQKGFNWNGPYVNLNRKVGTKFPVVNQPVGLPLDPWGNPYMLFTIEGLVKEPDGVIATSWTAADGQSYNTKVFDRPTVLSLGPNGLPGDGTGGGASARLGLGDDSYRQF
ncbi:MAG: prepilin-type N-terminal cleavage/methylation domain-containing protein [bacterium]|nr:prepilin-type N-terminal cleavage/methylation domain-containing protein [Candidatus Sumerlaeota bacterium]